MVIALTGGELLYFELNPISGSLLEVEKKDMSEISEDVACLDLAPVPEGRQRCR